MDIFVHVCRTGLLSAPTPGNKALIGSGVVFSSTMASALPLQALLHRQLTCTDRRKSGPPYGAE